MASLIAAPHQIPTVVDVALEAMEAADAEVQNEDRECRLVFILDYLWDHGYVLASRRRFWAKRVTSIILAIVIGGYLARGITNHESNAFLFAIGMWLLGIALGAHIVAWIKPTWARK